MKYPSKKWPKGIRGAGAMFAPANFSQNGGDYLRTANDNILVIVQIESRLAVENCEKIAAVDGIGKYSAIFSGPRTDVLRYAVHRPERFSCFDGILGT